MKHKIILATILILSGNQIFSQDSIKGRLIDYETKQSIFGATIADANNRINGSPSGGGISDRDGNFKIAVKGNKINFEIYFPGYYQTRFINFPKGDNNIDLKEIKLVPNHLTDHIVVGRPSKPISEEQQEQDKKLRMNVLENYRIKILGKNVKPYFEGDYNPNGGNKYLVFDFGKNEE